jgi:DNA invertase Pin-like site-specific DNA recombinase
MGPLACGGMRLIHEDSMSGSARSRPGVECALTDVVATDTLAVWKLDRRGRSLQKLARGR